MKKSYITPMMDIEGSIPAELHTGSNIKRNGNTQQNDNAPGTGGDEIHDGDDLEG